MHALGYDDRVMNHEIGHALLAHREGFPITWVNANRHTLDDDHGVVEFLLEDGVPREALARVLLAGEEFEPSMPSRSDREHVRALHIMVGSPPGWVEARRAEVREYIPDVRRASIALADALEANDRILTGPRAEAIIHDALCS